MCALLIIQTSQKLFSCNTLNHNYHYLNRSINKLNHVLSPQNQPPLQEMRLFLHWRDTICAGVNVSMNGGTMIISLLNYGMRLVTMNWSCAKNCIAQEKKQNSRPRAIQRFLHHKHSFLIAFIIPWVWKDVRMVSVCKERVKSYALLFSMDIISLSKHIWKVLWRLD